MRIESDSLGTKAVDDAAYYGIHTERARENFPVTSRPVDGRLVKNLILVKEACANANAETGRLAADKHRMIVNACEAILDDFDRFASDLRTPAIQGGAGTSTNMNANEVIANLAAEMAGAKKGTYELIHPNDDVNMAQSTNDVYPTAGHMALVEYTTDLLDQLEKTASSFLKLAHEHRFSLKMQSQRRLARSFMRIIVSSCATTSESKQPQLLCLKCPLAERRLAPASAQLRNTVTLWFLNCVVSLECR